MALSGARPYVADRAARGGRKLALNLDIDNTSLQTYYDPGKPIPATLRLARYAKSKGVYVLFNTGRNVSMRKQHDRASSSARASRSTACARTTRASPWRTSKQRCRRSFVNNGFTLIANVGNRSTDFVGGNYERAYRLPNYGNRLG